MSNISTGRSPGNRDGSSTSLDQIQQILSQALALHCENCLDEAAVIYREVLAIEPDNAQACFNLGAILQSDGDFSGAIKQFRKILQIEPDNLQALYFLANSLRDQGFRDEAIYNYRRITELGNACPDPHYNLGILYYHQEEYDLAMDCYREALDIDPSHADALYNRGIIHFERNEYDEAVADYENALAIRPGDVDTLYNLAFTRARQGQYEKAALHYHEAIEQSPDDPELHNSLGSVLRKLNEPELSLACYRRAVELRPDYGSAWTNLATIYQLLDQDDEAMTCYSRAIELGDHIESADYMMAALTGSNRQNPPPSYIKDLYDSYADNFEKSLLGNLSYNAPELLKKECINLLGGQKSFKRAVDLGCGTGLAGEQFRNIVDHLVGVDISGKMLAKAEEKAIYDHLCCNDIINFLENSASRDFDLVIAADVLIYLGALEAFFNNLQSRIKPGGYLFFSTEKLADAEGGYRLLKSGRYAQSEAYIRRLAASCGFQVESCREMGLRKEKEKWLRGFLFSLRKT